MSGPLPASDLAYAVHVEERRDYLRIVVSGVRTTLEAALAGWGEIARQVRAHRPRKVLIVSKLGGPMPSPEEQRLTLASLVGKGFEGVRTAFVLEDSVHVAALEHGEMYARELGQESRVFGSEALAEIWLRHGDGGVA
jgi:hypothetical protein